MGFFTSTEREKPVTQLRKLFHGKNKGKEREDPPPSFRPQATPVAEALSTPIYTRNTVAHQASSKSLPPSPLSPNHLHSKPIVTGAIPSRLHEASTSSLRGSRSSTHMDSKRPPTDNVTLTLAERLNELAAANADGLLNDEEYRLLRQNLFERFSSASPVPTEAPVVPVARSRPPRTTKEASSSSRTSISQNRLSAQFIVEVPRPESINSKSSRASGLFRLSTTSRKHNTSVSKDFSDTSSLFSVRSTASNLFKLPKLGSRKSSNSSLRTEAETASTSSKRPDRAPSESHRSVTRATPPSSFPRSVPPDSRTPGGNTLMNMFDEDNPASSVDIKKEVAAVEAEKRRLMDAFNGLELTTLAKRQRRSPLVSEDDRSPSWAMSENRSQGRTDSDMLSIRSITSTSPSMLRSPRSALRAQNSGTLSVMTLSRPGSMRRKNSVSSMSSGRHPASAGLAPPVPPLPGLGLGDFSNASSTSLAKSIPPISTIPEDGVSVYTDDMVEGENEMDEIRRRREEVSHRYDIRLEFLRAKLKGAQLHEKLMKR